MSLERILKSYVRVTDVSLGSSIRVGSQKLFMEVSKGGYERSVRCSACYLERAIFREDRIQTS
jgi:hypothetical protein